MPHEWNPPSAVLHSRRGVWVRPPFPEVPHTIQGSSHPQAQPDRSLFLQTPFTFAPLYFCWCYSLSLENLLSHQHHITMPWKGCLSMKPLLMASSDVIAPALKPPLCICCLCQGAHASWRGGELPEGRDQVPRRWGACYRGCGRPTTSSTRFAGCENPGKPAVLPEPRFPLL